ncbi:styrene monooxygenase/indole monooxygenase family protein [Bacillus sp. Marseille-Q3570]|uniref:styrene monooxygenase/indole monooxygenase family protein n=1 Tax=Bacillus sp. Marseille-Q3570 TaxID=2963522 RepID=UPI0021B7982D|nr:styrene monooxygenase/indole monooxygenase family protein [Bacillus sp. Marseille-Q3570]
MVLKKKIGIIGSGTAGLHLAYALRNDFDLTVFHSSLPEEIRKGRIMSTQVHFGPTRLRERRFDMPEWVTPPLLESIHITVGEQKLFVGKLNESASSIDQRLYFSHCLEDLKEKGVAFRNDKVDEEQLRALTSEFDLIIDCSGKSGPLFSFPLDTTLSPFHQPQRKCAVGYFNGVTPEKPLGVNVTILPEIGEMFEIPAMTEAGQVTILFLMPIPNQKLDVFKGIKSGEGFTARMKVVLEAFFPNIYKRVDKDNFSLSDEGAFLQVAIKPEIRKPYLTFNECLVVGCGDSVFLNDPITGQGCNLSSYCAEQLYETLIENKDTVWDSRVGESYWERVQLYVKEVTEWTNAMTQPIPQHIIELLVQGAEDRSIADNVAEWFAQPTTAHEAFFHKSNI